MIENHKRSQHLKGLRQEDIHDEWQIVINCVHVRGEPDQTSKDAVVRPQDRWFATTMPSYLAMV